MNISLEQVLALVGKLDDSSGDNTPRERFRQYLASNVLKVGQLRDYVEECLRKSGDNYNCALQDRTPGRKSIKPGDWICFYISGGTGVAAHARVASYPERKPHPKVRHAEKYPWVFKLTDTELYLDRPVVIDAEKRAQLEAFEDKDPHTNWAWLVQATRKISAHDFEKLTR